MLVSFCTLFFILVDFKFVWTQKPKTAPNPLSTTVRSYKHVSQTTAQILERISELVNEYGGGFHKGHSVEVRGKEYHIGQYGYGKNKDQQTCQIEQKDYPPWNMTYDNDRIINEILFECTTSEKCCELECCSPVAWWIIFLAVVASVAILLLCCCICSRCKKTEKEITEQVQEESDELLRTGHFGGSMQKLPKV